ncbi:MAG: C45 family autoproteolytic acyltransferase/hydrolase, partial [Bradymonadaceae bacterium]
MAESFTHLGTDPVESAWDGTAPEDPSFEVVDETDSAPGRVETPSGDIHFVNASGTLPEMGHQVGRKTRELVPDGPLPFYTTFLARTLEDSPVGRLSHLAGWATRKCATDRIIEGFDGEFRRAAEAFADAIGMTPRSLLKAYAVPETFLWLVGTIHRLAGAPGAVGLGGPPVGGCTSAVIRPPAGDTLLHGCNFDYVGIDFWEQTATVHFYHPDDGLDYVSVTSAGIFGGGLTAMNAAGVTLAVHQHFVDDFDLDGDPVGVTGDRVMRLARNLDEAIDILREQAPVAGWSYVLTEGDSGECAVYETVPGNEHIYRLPDDEVRFGYSNVFWGEELEEAEIDFYPEYRRDN